MHLHRREIVNKKNKNYTQQNPATNVMNKITRWSRVYWVVSAVCGLLVFGACCVSLFVGLLLHFAQGEQRVYYEAVLVGIYIAIVCLLMAFARLRVPMSKMLASLSVGFVSNLFVATGWLLFWDSIPEYQVYFYGVVVVFLWVCAVVLVAILGASKRAGRNLYDKR